MFKQLHEIKGMQAISLVEGRSMGSIQRVYLDPAKKRVSGLVVREAGLGGQESWIDIKDVEKVGEDVLFINRAGSCKAKTPVGRSLKDLQGMQITSRDGKILGTLVDVEIGEEWRVVELELSDRRMLKVDPKQTVFGQDAIMVAAGAAGKLRSVGRQKSGFLARVFGIEHVQETADAISRAEKVRVGSAGSTPPVANKPAKTKTSSKKPPG